MYNGLSHAEVEQRKAEGSINGQTRHMTRTVKQIVRANTLTYFNLVNTVLFVIVMTTGRFANGMFFLTIVFNAVIGIFQEVKSKELLDRMAIMVATHTDVKRDGKWSEIAVEDIVLDDLIRLRTGLQVPADCEMLDGYLEVNESMLTGEADTVIKKKGDHLYAGTVITSGEAEVKVIRVGKHCVSAQIMEEAQKESRARSVLHEDLEKLIRVISIVIIPAGIFLFIIHNRFIGMEWNDAVLKTVAAVVGMIPEGLVVLTSIALAVSTIRLSMHQVLVQDLFSIESLARVDTICLDKTGTLTQGTMAVSEVRPIGNHTEEEIQDLMSSYLAGEEGGNATTQAMIAHFGTEVHYAKTEVLPFSSDRKYAGAVLKGKGSCYVGAYHFLFPNGCDLQGIDLNTYTERGERVILLAHSASETISKDALPEDIQPFALIAIRDVLRDHVQEIMKYFLNQKVHIKVISGDDPATVSSLARQAGIPHADALIDMTHFNGSFEEAAETYTVFGRVLPDQKQSLVKALQTNGHTVVMTGDGVNDVPALKAADVSVAMAAGAAAAKDSANIVLLDNDFSRMPKIVDEGRRVINNISRASSMYLVKTTFSILLSLYVIFLHKEYPFLPVHLSVISAFGVGIPTFLLQLEPDFDRVKGNFFRSAFANAVPSAIAVFLTAMVCIVLRAWMHLPDEEFYGIFVWLTAYIYFYTLYRVYAPPTKLRIGVLIAMVVLMSLLLMKFGPLVSISLNLLDAVIIGPAMLMEPYLINCIAYLYERVAAWNDKTKRRIQRKVKAGKDKIHGLRRSKH